MDCIDLREWANSKHYKWRFEESYKAERQENRGDGRWFVEVLCKNGFIYPKGGTVLSAYANRNVKRLVANLGPDVKHHQTDGNAEIFSFPVDRLDEVAAILRPRKRRVGGSSPEHMKAMRERQKSLTQRT